MTTTGAAEQKIDEIKTALKKAGLWKKQAPSWVTDYQEKLITTEQDFSDWLQFVYLPNMLNRESRNSKDPERYIVPQAMKFFSEDVQKGKLLQLLVELDALL